MMFSFMAAIPPDLEEESDPPVASQTLKDMFFNHTPIVEEENLGGLDQDLWWEDDQQDFDFGNF